MTWKTPRGLTEALRTSRPSSKRQPNDGDRPPPTPLPGLKARPLSGQLSLVDEIATTDEERSLP